MLSESALADPGLELITTFLFSAGLDQPLSGPTVDALAPMSRCYLLPYSMDRLRAAALDFGWSKVLENLDQPDRSLSLAREVEQHVVESHGEAALDPAGLFIVRVAFRRDGVPRFLSGLRPSVPGVPYYPLSLPAPGEKDGRDVAPVIPVHLDPGAMSSSLFTRHKTSYRGEYNAARMRVGFDDTVGFTSGEMMLQNKRGEVMGGGVTTVYFFRGGAWITPAQKTGCKMGVSRRWALEHAGVQEAVVLAKDVEEGEEVWVSSAVGGWREGVVRLGPRLDGS